MAMNHCLKWVASTPCGNLSLAVPIGREAEAVPGDRNAIEDAVANRQELDRATRAIAVLPTTLKESLVLLSCPLLSGPSTITVWTKEGTTNACEEAQARGDYREAT